jgi:predicted O-methyltransferase YrrM
MLEARLRPGAVVLADNVDMAAVARGGFLDHVTDPKGRYLTARLGFDNSELSHSVVVG